VRGLPANFALLLTGWSAATSSLGPLPLPTDPLGMPGCTLYTSADVLELVSGTSGTATWTAALPAVTSLIGQSFHQQALVVDPGAGNALQAVLSRAYTATIGG
jgi:hypothetical protein